MGIGRYGYIKNYALEPDAHANASSLRGKIGKESEVNERISRAFWNSCSKSNSSTGSSEHSFHSIVQKQIEVLFRQLSLPWNIDFKVLRKDDEERKEKEKDKEDDESNKEKKKVIGKARQEHKINLHLGARASEAIASSARSWVHMRNAGLLKLATKILANSKDPD